jgi:hypothetical protein
MGSDYGDRFWSKVAKTRDGCWEWAGGMFNSGYGQFCIRHHPYLAHRVAYELTYGPIPSGSGYHGTCVCHRCDNKSCVNPSHLFLGTHQDNIRDRVAKGRSAVGDRSGSRLHPESRPRGDSHWTRTMPGRVARGTRHGSVTRPECVSRGERNGQSNLVVDDIKEMRLLRSVGCTAQEIAKIYGVSSVCVSYVCLRRTWAHVL